MRRARALLVEWPNYKDPVVTRTYLIDSDHRDTVSFTWYVHFRQYHYHQNTSLDVATTANAASATRGTRAWTKEGSSSSALLPFNCNPAHGFNVAKILRVVIGTNSVVDVLFRRDCSFWVRRFRSRLVTTRFIERFMVPVYVYVVNRMECFVYFFFLQPKPRSACVLVAAFGWG
jgi:hypothetical protein